MKRTIIILITIIITAFAFTMNSDTEVFGNNPMLRKFYVPNLFKVVSLSEAERYRGNSDVVVHAYYNLNRAYVMFKKQAQEYAKNGGFGQPISREIPYLGIIDGTNYERDKPMLVGRDIYVLNFERYRKMSLAWRYHDLFVYGANQVKGSQVDKSAPLIKVNSLEARLLRHVAHSSYRSIYFYLRDDLKVIPQNSMLIFDRRYKRYEQQLKSRYKGDITDLCLRVMDLTWEIISTREAAALAEWDMLYIANSPEHGLGRTKPLPVSAVSHIPTFTSNRGASVDTQLTQAEMLEAENALSSMIRKGSIKPLWNRWDTDTWEHMNQAKKVLVVSSDSHSGSELYQWLRIMLEMKVITTKHMLAHLIVALAYQDIWNNAAFIGRKANVDYVIDEDIRHIPIFKKFYPNAQFIPFYREYNRLIRASGGTAWLYWASVSSSRYIWKGGATGIGNIEDGIGVSSKRVKELITNQYTPNPNAGDIQKAFTGMIQSTINMTPNTMNQPGNGKAIVAVSFKRQYR